jgi:ribonuclease Z
MTPLFLPRLVNSPLGDPALYVDLKFDHRALMFDLGDIQNLPPRAVLKISHIFISHTHIDHFIGFDRLVRICLGRPKMVTLFGPPDFLDQVAHKLSAYTWNLVGNYAESLDIMAHEIHPDGSVRSALMRSARAFAPEQVHECKARGNLIHEEGSFSVRTAFVDHKTPCLAFALEERFHVNILKTGLADMGLTKGPWIRRLKEALWQGEAEDLVLNIPVDCGNRSEQRAFKLGELRRRLVRITAGQKIGYVTDTLFSEATRGSILGLIKGADYLFMETAFLGEDQSRAMEKHHLTAKQAGRLAAEAGVGRLIPFHISPKYTRHPERVIQEALGTFQALSQKKKL